MAKKANEKLQLDLFSIEEFTKPVRHAVSQETADWWFKKCAPSLMAQSIGAKFLQSYRDQNKDCARSQANRPQATTIHRAVPHITIVEDHGDSVAD